MKTTPQSKSTQTSPIKYDLVKVFWDDAETTHGWEQDEEVKERSLTCLSVGFLVYESKTQIVLATSLDITNGANNSRQRIPRGMIRSMKVLSAKSKP